MFVLCTASERFRHDLRLPEEQSAVCGEFLPHVLEVGVSHVGYGEDEDVLVGVEGGLEGGVEGGGFFFRGFLLHYGGVDDAGAFGFGHCGGEYMI